MKNALLALGIGILIGFAVAWSVKPLAGGDADPDSATNRRQSSNSKSIRQNLPSDWR